MKSKNTAVIVQCRLSSTRFPQKALKLLGGKTILEWTLNAMRRVDAARHYVAVDESSFDALKPIALKCGWDIFAGPLEDVLERYCLLIKKLGCKTVVRATADNPFLFYEAADALCGEFFRQSETMQIDYMTWTGLPHGSGVEIFDAESLLTAAAETADPFDREHVGPALYHHKNRFTSLFLRAPSRFFFPDYRTTIDTPADFRRAEAIVDFLSGGAAPSEPYSTEQILSAVQNPSVYDRALFVPSVQKGRGTGHLRRCLEAARTSGAFVYVPERAELEEAEPLVQEFLSDGLKESQIVRQFPEKGEYSLIAADLFSCDAEMAKKLRAAAPFAALDEGSAFSDYCDYLLDIIPSYRVTRQANMQETAFIELPASRREGKARSIGELTSALVCLGGEDPAGLTWAAAEFFASEGRKVTAIVPESKLSAEVKNRSGRIEFAPPVKNLRERLCAYSLVVTHYGLTAFEAAAAGCAVILLATTDLHQRLSEKYGFVCLDKKALASSGGFDKSGIKPASLYPSLKFSGGAKNLGAFVQELSHAKRLSCPVCGGERAEVDAVMERTERRTYRRCGECGMAYLSWSMDGQDKKYTKAYFAEQYKEQYGRTYLEDFEAIKTQAARRIREIDAALQSRAPEKPAVLDIGCAYGPFLAAAEEDGWLSFGTDVAEDAVEYVQKTLRFPAVASAFPHFDAGAAFGVNQFDAVTMWFVIEHFTDLKAVLEKTAALVKNGGVFAFSTPSGAGVSARFNRHSFFTNSPSDHYTIWEPKYADKIMRRFGFRVVKIVSTGHHAERFPPVKKNGWQKHDIRFQFFDKLSRLAALGDTFEIYCRKYK